MSPAELDKIRRHFAAAGLRQWISQTVRDAQVCGNGYLAIASEPEPTTYTLRPEEVIVHGPQRFALVGDGRDIDATVVHLRGIDQFESPYGISVLEPIMAMHRTRRTFDEVARRANAIREEWPPSSREALWATETLELVDRALVDIDGRLGKLLEYPRDWLPSARDGLYFPGQESM